MNSCLNLSFLIVTTAATVFIAFFTYLVWRINKRQHDLHYEQDLYLHPTKPTSKIVNEKELECHIACILVNPCKLPVVITRIELLAETKSGEEHLHIVGGFVHEISAKAHYFLKDIPEERPEKVYINQIPWVIEGDSFAIFSKRYSSLPLEYVAGKFRVVFYYRDYKSGEDVSREVLLQLPKIEITF